MKIYIDGTAAPEDGDTLIAATSQINSNVLVYKDSEHNYWIVDQYKIFNTIPYDADRVVKELVSRLDLSMHKECQHF